MYNMERLFDKVAANGNLFVGLDTAPDYIPVKERKAAASDP
jgi:hypothetical protein